MPASRDDDIVKGFEETVEPDLFTVDGEIASDISVTI